MLGVIWFLVLWGAKGDAEKIDYGAPLDPAIWEIREDPEKGIYDAVIVEDFTELLTRYIRYYRQIRILSEDGKEAAEIVLPAKHVSDLKGRVIDASGKETVFGKEDLVEVLALKTRRYKERTLILVPPGLTSDCVVEWTWRVKSVEGVPKDDYEHHYDVQEPYFCMKKVFQVNSGATKPQGTGLATRFVFPPMKEPARYTAENKGRTRYFIYENVPPLQYYPYGNRYRDKNAVRVSIFKTFPNYGKGPAFWKDYAYQYLKSLFESDLKASRDYRKWIKEVKAGMPQDQREAVAHVFEAFRQRISSTNLLTPQKKAARAGNEEKEWSELFSIAKIFDRGYTFPGYMGSVFYKIARDCDLPLQILLTTSKYGPRYDPRRLQPFNLQPSKALFGLQLSKHEWAVLTPNYPEYPIWSFPSYYQGELALAVDPGKDWQVQFTSLPSSGPKHNQFERRYQSVLGADGTIRFEVSESGTGVYQADMMEDYFGKTPEEREEKLARVWRNRLDDFEVVETSVAGIDRLDDKVVLKVTAEGKVDVGELEWLTLGPFPGSRLPLSIPSIWPPNRKQDINLPYALIQVDHNAIEVPPGWRLRGTSWEKKNEVGKVSFQARQQGNQIEIQRQIVIKKASFPPGFENRLKALVAWMEEAWYQTIALEGGQS